MRHRVPTLATLAVLAACGEAPTAPTMDFEVPLQAYVGQAAGDLVIDDFVFGTGAWAACGGPVFALHEDASIAGGARELALIDRGSCVWGLPPSRIAIDAAQGTAKWYGGGWRNTYAAQQVFAYGTEIGTLDQRFMGTGYFGNNDPFQSRTNTPLDLSLTLDDQILIEVAEVRQDDPDNPWDDPYVNVRVRDGQGRTFVGSMPGLSVGTNLLPLSAITGLDAAAAADIDGIVFWAYGAFNDPTGVTFDGIGIRPGVRDADGDDVNDDVDNCVDTYNPDQADLDNDGLGDACDPDRDGDNVSNDEDAFPDNGSEWADSDGDGVGDNADAYDNSDTRETLYVGTCNTGVGNKHLGNGTWWSDLIAAAKASAKNHGQFVSAVAELAGGWKKAGEISGRQQGAIVSCTARSK